MSLVQFPFNTSNTSTLYDIQQVDICLPPFQRDYNNSMIDSTVSGNRLYETEQREVILIQKTPAEVAGEQLLRPMVEAVSGLASVIGQAVFAKSLGGLLTSTFASAKKVFIRFDRAFSFPMAEAAGIPDVNKIRKLIDDLGNIALTEDMVKRIIEDKTGVDYEPKVVKVVKELLDIIGTISNPANFYGNLVQGKLEAVAIEKLKQLEKQKKSYDQQLEKILAKRALQTKISNLEFEERNKVKEIEMMKGDENTVKKYIAEVEQLLSKARKDQDEDIANKAEFGKNIYEYKARIQELNAYFAHDSTRTIIAADLLLFDDEPSRQKLVRAKELIQQNKNELDKIIQQLLPNAERNFGIASRNVITSEEIVSVYWNDIADARVGLERAEKLRHSLESELAVTRGTIQQLRRQLKDEL